MGLDKHNIQGYSLKMGKINIVCRDININKGLDKHSIQGYKHSIQGYKHNIQGY